MMENFPFLLIEGGKSLKKDSLFPTKKKAIHQDRRTWKSFEISSKFVLVRGQKKWKGEIGFIMPWNLVKIGSLKLYDKLFEALSYFCNDLQENIYVML